MLFSFNTLNMLSSFLLTAMVSDEKSADKSNWCSLLFAFVFQQFSYNLSVYFEFIQLGVYWASWMYRLTFHQIWELLYFSDALSFISRSLNLLILMPVQNMLLSNYSKVFISITKFFIFRVPICFFFNRFYGFINNLLDRTLSSSLSLCIVPLVFWAQLQQLIGRLCLLPLPVALRREVLFPAFLVWFVLSSFFA